MQEPVAYLNEELVPVSQARLHVFDLGIVGGCAVTEMVRTFRHRPFRLDDHLQRLAASCDAVGFPLPKSLDEVRTLAEDIVRHNSRLISAGDDLGLIVFVTAGLNPTYVGRPAARHQGLTLCVHTFPLPWDVWKEKYHTGLSLAVPDVQNIPPEVIDPQIKHRSRLHWWLADRSARSIDADASALVLDQRGHISETAAGNVCLVRQGVIRSPASGMVLEGVSLQVVAELCGELGIPFERGDLRLPEMEAADECFITSTPPCLLPVTRVNRRPIGTGRPGPITGKLLAAWSRLAECDIVAQMQSNRK